MSRLVGGHFLQLRLEFGKFELFRQLGVRTIVGHIFRLHLHVEFEHPFEGGRLLEGLRGGRWFPAQVLDCPHQERGVAQFILRLLDQKFAQSLNQQAVPIGSLVGVANDHTEFGCQVFV